MALEDQTLVGGVWTPTAARAVNTTGAPLTSVADNGDGEAIADVYTLVLSAVAGGTATVTVAASSPNNPYNGKVVSGVPLDGATAVTNVVPGLNVIFSNTGANGNVGTVYVGQFLGTFDSFGAGAGVPSASVRHRVLNAGTGAAESAKASLQTQAVMFKKVGRALQFVSAFAPGATEKVAGGGSTRTMPYALSIANVSGAGSAKVADLYVDGVIVGAGVLTDPNGTAVGGAGIKAISPAYIYTFNSGPLTGLQFALDANCANGDIGNVLIFASRDIQIAPEVAGAPGAFATTDVVLTQSGQPAGVIQAGGEAFFYVRALVPSGESSEKNPLPANVALSGIASTAANWNG